MSDGQARCNSSTFALDRPLEGFEQIYLSIGEGANLGASDGNHTDCMACADQWNGQYGAVANASGEIPAFGVILPFGLYIGDLNRSLVENGAPDEKASRQCTVSGMGIGPWWATTGRKSPSTLWIAASLASQSRVALAAISSNTRCRSLGELEMTLRISAVAALLLSRLTELVPGLAKLFG